LIGRITKVFSATKFGGATVNIIVINNYNTLAAPLGLCKTVSKM